MKYNRFFGLIIAGFVLFTVGCMDINPPLNNHASDELLLHSIHLPFKKAIYGVGDRDSIVVLGVLVTGDTISIDPARIKWQMFPVTSSIEIDSMTGLIRALESNSVTLAGTGLRLRVSYTLGGITKMADADIFITDDTYEIAKFQLTSLDSGKGGSLSNSYFLLSFLQGQVLDMPKAHLEVQDKFQNTPVQFNSINHVNYFLTDFETGKRFNQVKIAPLAFLPPIYPKGLYIFGNAPLGDYWIGIETYLYGTLFKDSIRFTQMAPAELYLNATSTSVGVPSITANTSIAQPCAIVLMNNTTRDTISIEMPPPDYECTGMGAVPNGRLVVPPNRALRLRTLGYTAGSTMEWKAFLGAASQKEFAKGTINLRL